KGDKILAMFQVDNPGFYLRLFSMSGNYKTVDTKGVLVFDASWDPTGEFIAITGRNFKAESNELWVISADDTQAHKILMNQLMVDVSWSPDGKQLTYSSNWRGYPSAI